METNVTVNTTIEAPSLEARERALVRKALSRYADELEKEAKRLGSDGLQLDDAYADLQGHLGDVTALRLRFQEQRELPLEPTPLEEGAPENLRDLLLLVGHDLDLEVIGALTDAEREAAWAWAGAVHLAASDNDVAIPEYPAFLQPFRTDGQDPPTP